MIKIKIIKELNDVDKRIRPVLGHVYDVRKVISALYNPQQNKAFIVDVRGFETVVFTDECLTL